MVAANRGAASATALAAAAGARLATVERTIRRGEMTPLHVHGGDEAYLVLEGELTLHVGGEAVRLRAGASYIAPAGVPHAHRAESDHVRIRTATAVASASRYDDFARAAAVPSGAAAAEDAAALGAIAAANGIVVLGLPGTTAAGEAAQ